MFKSYGMERWENQRSLYISSELETQVQGGIEFFPNCARRQFFLVVSSAFFPIATLCISISRKIKKQASASNSAEENTPLTSLKR